MKGMNGMNTASQIVGETRLSGEIIGAAHEVANTLGVGFLEKVYETALAIELRRRGHRVDQQRSYEVFYKGELAGIYQADMIVNDEVVVELKAVRGLEAVHRAQCLNYLRATGIKVGLLINFGQPRIDVQRVQSFAH
jgi:GxxExxY protein